MVVGHAVKEEGGVSGVGRFHFVPYGVPIVGPCHCCYADMQWFCMCKTHFAYYYSLMVVRRYGAASCLLCICQ